MSPEDVIRDATTEDLLDAIIQLTHKIHGLTDKSALRDLRQQRDLAKAEILRRTVPTTPVEESRRTSAPG